MLEKFITPVKTDTPLSEKTAQNQLRIILSVVFFGFVGLFVGLAMPYLIFPALFLNSSSAFLPSDCSALYRGVVLGVTLGAFPLGQFFGSPVLGALSDE
ncbi:MAG: hypothetical protein KDK40_05460, partial [Chlamydiia bacterium]|nr:hypothetical protein [Chlamydiia bacterium]